MKAIYLILISILFISSGQLLLKSGLSNLGQLDFSSENLANTAITILSTPRILLGLSLFILSSVLWLTALSRTELSYAYPLLSIGYAIVAVASWILFRDNISITRAAGIMIIIIGVSVLSLDGRNKQ